MGLCLRGMGNVNNHTEECFLFYFLQKAFGASLQLKNGPKVFRTEESEQRFHGAPRCLWGEMGMSVLPEGPRTAGDAFQGSCLTSLSEGLLSGPGDCLGIGLGNRDSSIPIRPLHW